MVVDVSLRCPPVRSTVMVDRSGDVCETVQGWDEKIDR